jgi:hypothetical protein
MSSIYWAEFPIKLESSAKKLKISKSLIFWIIESIASQIFGLLLYTINLDLGKLLLFNYIDIIQIAFNYLFFKVIQLLAYQFEFAPLPIFTNKRHEKLIKTILLPTSGFILVLQYGLILVLLQDVLPGLTIAFWPILYSYVANSLFILLTDQFARIAKSSKKYSFHLITTVLLLIIIIIILGIFYYIY